MVQWVLERKKSLSLFSKGTRDVKWFHDCGSRSLPLNGIGPLSQLKQVMSFKIKFNKIRGLQPGIKSLFMNGLKQGKISMMYIVHASPHILFNPACFRIYS